MIERNRIWVDEQLDEAECEQRCASAKTRTDLHRFRQAVRMSDVLEVWPHMYVRKELWTEKLSATERTLHIMRTLQRKNPELVFAGPSAAAVYGLSVSNRYLNHIWIRARPGAHRRNDARVQSILVSNDEERTIDDLRVTSPARTVGDCLRIMNFDSGLAVADSAVKPWVTSADQLWADVQAACPRMSGIARIGGVIRLADGRSDSGGESIARAVMMELGIAVPVLQRSFVSSIDRQSTYYVDFSWDTPDGVILAELDGSEKYENPVMRGALTVGQTIGNEHRRQSHLVANREVRRIVRFGLADVMRFDSFLQLLVGCGVPRTFAMDEAVLRAGGVLRCR